jgi:acyl-coenzyme A thioesterase PaaI-like protein
MPAISIEEAAQLLHRSVPPWMLALYLQVRAIPAESALRCMPCDEHLLRPGRIIAGQALMALADTAMVLALWAACGAFRSVATVDMPTTCMRPAPQTTIVAEVAVLRPGRTMGFCHVLLLADTMERP